ncbi:MAG: VOC family protein [Chromatiales bacterium]|nr:VOC family protein [Chromatiales bacterium]
MSAITVRGIDHLVLRTAQVDTLRRFYGEVLGCHLERAQEALGLYQLRAGSALIDLVDVNGQLGRAGGPAPGEQARNLDHFCLRVDPFDEAAIRAHLTAHGVDAPETARRYGAEGSGPSIYIADPDGNVVELKGPPDRAVPAAG